MERLCRKCREPIPAGRPTANDCGSPKCKSKAYRDRRRNLERQLETEAAEVLAKSMGVPEKKSQGSPTTA